MQVRFTAAADRARARLEEADALPLLHAHALYIHLPERARKLMGANAAALRRVAGPVGWNQPRRHAASRSQTVGVASGSSPLADSSPAARGEERSNARGG